jgi:cyclopropane fatty-acyl-phospholipid synthase-like methyltransferase
MYELIYRLIPADVIFGSSSKIEDLVEVAIDGRIEPCKAITLGCGTGRETIYLEKMGFDVIGVDFSSTAIKKARRKAKAAGIEVQFLVDDLTDLQHVVGTYDLITDFGALNDMSQKSRAHYMENVLPLTHIGSYYLMFCFDRMLPPEEVRKRFEGHFSIEVLEARQDGFPGTLTLYLMTRT